MGTLIQCSSERVEHSGEGSRDSLSRFWYSSGINNPVCPAEKSWLRKNLMFLGNLSGWRGLGMLVDRLVAADDTSSPRTPQNPSDVRAGATSRRIHQGRGNASPATSGKSPDEEKAGRFVTCALYMARIAGILRTLQTPWWGAAPGNRMPLEARILNLTRTFINA